MTVQAAATLAQVLPALLAIGLLVPVLSGMRVSSFDRLFFKSQILSVLVAEAMCLWSVMADTAWNSLWYGWMAAIVVWLAITISLSAIWLVFHWWTKRTTDQIALHRVNRILSKFKLKLKRTDL